jgi:hypothetical protein
MELENNGSEVKIGESENQNTIKNTYNHHNPPLEPETHQTVTVNQSILLYIHASI